MKTVLDDENPTEVTTGSIVTVIVTLTRKPMSSLFGDETAVDHNLTIDNSVDGDANKEGGGDNESQNQAASIKRPAWLKQKRGGGKKSKKPTKQPQKVTAVKPKVEESPVPSSEKKKHKEEKKEEESEESDVSDAETNDKSSEEDSAQKSNNEDEDQEWEKFRKLHEREKSLQGKSKTSHPVHCPFFPNDKQEYWWTYICDRKSRTLLTVPHYVTSLVEQEVIHLKVIRLMIF